MEKEYNGFHCNDFPNIGSFITIDISGQRSLEYKKNKVPIQNELGTRLKNINID